jgi:hypothetical protein
VALKSVSVRVPRDELERWQRHAATQGIPVAEWIYRAVRLVLDTDIADTTTITGRPKRLLSRVMGCEWCGRKFDRNVTRRRRYCDANCRVRAWRARSASLPTERCAE